MIHTRTRKIIQFNKAVATVGAHVWAQSKKPNLIKTKVFYQK